MGAPDPSVVVEPEPVVEPVEDRNKSFYLTSLMSMYALGGLEAEQVYALAGGVGDRERLDAAVAQVRGQRVVYRQRWEAVDPRLGHAGSVINNSAPASEDEGRLLEDIPGDPTTLVVDSTQPESGPHGPYADYHPAKVTDSEIAERTGIDPGTALPVGKPKEED